MALLCAEFPKTHAHQKGIHGTRVLTQMRAGKPIGLLPLQLKHTFWPWAFWRVPFFFFNQNSCCFLQSLYLSTSMFVRFSTLLIRTEWQPGNSTSSLVTLECCNLKLLMYSNTPGFVCFFVWVFLSPAFQTPVIYKSVSGLICSVRFLLGRRYFWL